MKEKRDYKNDMGIGWEHFATRTERGTLLIRRSIEAVLDDLNRWHYQERTGIIMAKSEFLVPWKSVLTKVNMLDADGSLSIDTKKLWNVLEGDIEKWEEDFKTKKSSNIPEMDEKIKTSIMKSMHDTFDKSGKNELVIDVLAAFIAGIEGDVDETKNYIRGVSRTFEKTFSIGAGAAPKVRRLMTAKGKATQLEAFDNTRDVSEAGRRFSKSIKALGFKSKEEFETAKKDIGNPKATDEELVAWIKEEA